MACVEDDTADRSAYRNPAGAARREHYSVGPLTELSASTSGPLAT